MVGSGDFFEERDKKFFVALLRSFSKIYLFCAHCVITHFSKACTRVHSAFKKCALPCVRKKSENLKKFHKNHTATLLCNMTVVSVFL